MRFLTRLFYSPFFTQLVVIRRCNLSCGYCNEYDDSSAPVGADILKSRLRKLKSLGAFSVCLTGGEPTLHPDLPELVRYARHELGFFRTSVITNGFTMTPESVRALNDAGLQDMQISIDGVKPNATTVKVLDSLRRRMDILRDHARFNVIVSGVVGACPPGESFEIVLYAKNSGFRPRVLLVHGPDGQVRLSPEQMSVYRKIKEIIPRHIYEPSDYRDRLIRRGSAPFKCRAGSRYLYVDENGLVSWCSQTRAFWSKPLDEYTEDDLREQFYSRKSCHERCSLGCVRSASAFDFWRRQEPGRAAKHSRLAAEA